MGISNIIPYQHNPRGVTDSLDDGQGLPGGMRSLSNLIFDPSTPYTFRCRPANTVKIDFSTQFTAPGIVSCAYAVGDIIYGLVSSSDITGHDSPFAYNTATDLFLTVSGTINSTTTPTTPSSSGAWTPPTMDLMGPLLAVTHPGFPNTTYAFGWFDITTPTAPVWHAGTTTTNALTAVPVAVAQFNNRLYFAVENRLEYTDALTLTRTSTSQSLTFGSSLKITALAPQPLMSTTQGGVVQSLLAFKGASIAQITGDAATSNLALNELSSSVGTYAPRSVSATPMGVAFMAIDGIRLIDNTGVLSTADDNIRIPFINAITPSRVSGCYNAGVYRICTQNGAVSGQPYEEYWYDSNLKAWTGPHTFRQDLAIPFLDRFAVFNNSVTGKMFESTVFATSSSTFTENGTALSFTWETAPLNDIGNIYQNSATLTTIDMELPTDGSIFTAYASDATRGSLSTATIVSPTSGAVWGAFTWGAALWTAVKFGLRTYNIPWTTPVVFNKLLVKISGACTLEFKIGKMRVGYEPLNYINTGDT